MEDDGATDNQEHFVAALASLVDCLAARKVGLAEVRCDDSQALVVKALPSRPSDSMCKVRSKDSKWQPETGGNHDNRKKEGRKGEAEGSYQPEPALRGCGTMCECKEALGARSARAVLVTVMTRRVEPYLSLSLSFPPASARPFVPLP